MSQPDLDSIVSEESELKLPARCVTVASETLPELSNRVLRAGERVELERHGKPVAAIVSIEDMRLLEALEDQPEVKAPEAALADPENRETIPWEKVKAEPDLQAA